MKKLLPHLKSRMRGVLSPSGITLSYAAFVLLWMFISGYLLSPSAADSFAQNRNQLFEWLVFVVITSSLLYLLLRVRGVSNQDDGNQPIGAKRLLLIFAALVLVVPLVGFAVARIYGPQIEREAYANLEAIAQLKAEQIENWMGERYADASVLAGDDAFVARAARFVRNEHDVELARLIQVRFKQLVSHYHYTKILLLDTNGRLLLNSGEDVTTTPVPHGLLRRTWDSKQVQRSDIYRDEEGHIHIEWAVPLVVSDTKGQHLVAIVVLRITAQQFIFPLIQTWPTASPSGETLLVRREGSSVLFLNELRHLQGSALRLRLSMSNASLPCAIAISENRIGVAAGVDYRGVQVLSAYRPVKGANWYLVAKIDRDEVLAPLRSLIMWISLIALIAIAVVGAAVMLLWRQQHRANQLEIRARSMAAIEESERHFHSLFENMLEGYAHCKMLFREGVADEFVYLEVNPAFEKLSGLKNVVGKRASEVTPGIRESNPELFEAYTRVSQSGQSELLEMYVAEMGKWFSISIYCPEPEHFVAMFDDITARKKSEHVLAESELRFRSMVEQSLAGIYIIQDGRFAYVNPRFAEIMGYDSADELIGAEPTSLVTEQDRATVAENIRRRFEEGEKNISYSITAVRKDGRQIKIGVHGALATHEGRPAIIGLMQDVSEKLHAEEQIQRYVAQLENAFMNTIEVVTTLIEMRDPYTSGHEKRVGLIAAAIGTEMGLDSQRIEGLRIGGYVHDIGKIIVPAEILSKPGKISAAEYELIKGHPQAGYDILKNVDFPWPVADIAYQHHERMDGSGYPRGLKGEEILMEARITAVADVVEAIAAHRPYRPGFGVEKALAEIERGRGVSYDQDVVDACLRIFREQGFHLPVD